MEEMGSWRWTYLEWGTRPWTILRQSHHDPAIALIWNESTRIIAIIGRSILVGAR